MDGLRFIRDVHSASCGTYGLRRVRGELTEGLGVLVHHRVYREQPNGLWRADITEHLKTEHLKREGKVCCCRVLDTYSRRIIDWSIDSVQNSNVVVNALDMAIKNRRLARGGLVHADHGAQFRSWAILDRIRSAGLIPSFGTVGDELGDAMMESFLSSVQIELDNRNR